MQLDSIDVQILQALSEHSRIQWKDLGERIHMTGQAVGARIKKLEDSGVIKAYSLILDEVKLGFPYTAFVIIYMKTTDHDAFVRFINEHSEITEAHRISGEGCYHLTLKIESQERLNACLDQLLHYGNYNVNLSIKTVKDHGRPMPQLSPQPAQTET